MSKISLKHSGGNVVSLNSPTNAPGAADVAFKLPNADGSNGQAIVTDGSGNLSFANAGGGRAHNLIINGSMAIHQRSSSVTGITGSGYYTADRMQLVLANGGTWTNTISTDTPDGFAASYKLDCTTADASLGGDDFVLFRQIIEGHNLQDFAKGTSSAKQFTVSFYVKTNKTGTYVCELLDDTNSRQVSKSYTVSNTNWNRYTISFPADTSGTIADSNLAGLYVHFWLAAGTNFTSGTQQTSWASNTKANRVNGLNVNIADNTSNEWLITGVQLEVGSVASDFEHRSYGQELQLCKRYYQKWCEGNSKYVGNGLVSAATEVHASIYLPVTMRGTVAIDHTYGNDYWRIAGSMGGDKYIDSAWVVDNQQPNVFNIYATPEVSLSSYVGDAGYVQGKNAASYMAFSSEL